MAFGLNSEAICPYNESSTVRYFFTTEGRFSLSLHAVSMDPCIQWGKKRIHMYVIQEEGTYVGVSSSFSMENGSIIKAAFLILSNPDSLCFRAV